MPSKSFPLFVQGNANNSSDNNSRISFYLSPPVQFGDTAHVSFEIISASIWNNFPNISSAFSNNVLSYIYGGNPSIVSFPEGLYSITSINDFLSSYFKDLQQPTDLFVFYADPATSKVSIHLNYIGTAIDIGLTGSIGSILGWYNGFPTLTAGFAGDVFVAPNQAELNRVNRVLIHSNFCAGAYNNEQGGSDVIASVRIDTSPGRQIQFDPIHTVGSQVFARHLSYITFYLTDELGRPLDCQNEFWQLTGVFHIEEP